MMRDAAPYGKGGYVGRHLAGCEFILLYYIECIAVAKHGRCPCRHVSPK